MAVNVTLKSVFDDKGIRKAQKEFADFGKGLGVAFAAVGAATAAATAALIKFGADSIAAAENVAVANNRLGQVAKSMGIFGSQTGAVTDRLIKFAEANELLVAVDAEVIKATQAKLLTFKNLAATANQMGGEFDRATMAALDLAAAGFGSAETNAVQLGKALQDPIKGITALARAGVTFTAQEKENIKVLVQSGQTLEAQNLILQAIESQVGGTAEATAKASDKMKLAFDNISESVGAALLPVFQEFANEVVKITPELEAALAPAAEEIAQIFRERVLPAIQNFTKWLASPQGTQTLRDLTQAVIDAVENFVNFVSWAFKNRDAIAAFAVAVAGLTVAYGALRAAITLVTAAQLLFNSAVMKNPYVIAAIAIATGLAAIAAATYVVYQNTKQLTGAIENQRIAELRRQNAFEATGVQAATYRGLIPGLTYVTGATKELGNQAVIAAHGLYQLDQVKLNNLRKQLGDTAGEMNRFRNAAAGIIKTDTTITPPPVLDPKGESAFDRVRKFIKDAQKDLAKAQETYNEAIAKAQKKYADSVTKTQRDFQEKLTGIIQQSQDRIRDVFRQAASMSVSDFLNAFKSAEQKRLEAFNQAKEDAEKANKEFTDVFVGTDPVTAYLESLRNKLAANRRVLELSSRLFERGFSQVFIEQIIASGQEGGNALGEALLASGPETISEVQRLFNDINDQAETGMDALARDIFDKAGFATRELRNMYEKTQGELSDALLELKKTFDSEVLDANKTLLDSIRQIRIAFQENIDSMKGDLGGLGKTVKDFMDKLNAAEIAAATQIQTPIAPGQTPTGGDGPAGLRGVNLAASAVTNATGILIDSIADIELVKNYLEERIVAASEFAAQSINRGNFAAAASATAAREEMFSQLRTLRGAGAGAVGTVININVKTDSTQSLAMVGKTLGNTITKYVQTGGQVVVSPVG